MKRFSFRLQKVLNYKNQILDRLKNEHAEILGQVYRQQEYVDELKKTYMNMSGQYDNEKQQGIIKLENVMQYEAYLKRLDERIRIEIEKLKELNLKEEQKRAEVVQAKQETESIEKLKVKKLESYNKELRAEQDLIVEEFITNRRSAMN